MAWTYTTAPWAFNGQGAITQQGLRDSVRFLIGDTDTTDQQLQDGEIDGVLVQNGATITSVSLSTTGAVYLAAVECCGNLIAKYSRLVDKSVGDFRLSASQRLKGFESLKVSLKAQSMRHASPKPYLGGISTADMEIDREDTDLRQHEFAIGMMDDPGSDPDFGGTTTFTGAAP